MPVVTKVDAPSQERPKSGPLSACGAQRPAARPRHPIGVNKGNWTRGLHCRAMLVSHMPTGGRTEGPRDLLLRHSTTAPRCPAWPPPWCPARPSLTHLAFLTPGSPSCPGARNQEQAEGVSLRTCPAPCPLCPHPLFSPQL